MSAGSDTGADTGKQSFLRQFFALFFALALQNIITLSVNLADNIMLGAYREYALSGVAAVNQIQFVFQQLTGGLGNGIVILGSQYWGRGNAVPVRRIAASAMRFAMLIAAALFIAATFFPSALVGLFTTEPAIIAEGTAYLAIVRFTYLFFAATQILLAALRSVEVVGIAFRLSVMTLFVNCGINYVLIFGHFGMPEMGARGAAVGTLTARILEFAVLVFYLAFRDGRLKLNLRDFLRRDRVLGRDYLKIALPMMFLAGQWGVNTALQTAILGHMRAAAIAANSAASNLFLTMKSAAVAAADTGGIIIGKTIGEGDIGKVKATAVRLQKLFALVGLIGGAGLLILRIPYLSFFKLSGEAMGLANAFLIILACIYPTMAYQMSTNNGIIRGGGDTGFVIRLDLISIWLIVLPMSFIAAFVLKAPPVAVVCCLNADQVFKCVPAFLHARSWKWIRKLTRDEVQDK